MSVGEFWIYCHVSDRLYLDVYHRAMLKRLRKFEMSMWSDGGRSVAGVRSREIFSCGLRLRFPDRLRGRFISADLGRVADRVGFGQRDVIDPISTGYIPDDGCYVVADAPETAETAPESLQTGP